jgi:hypothetical protein
VKSFPTSLVILFGILVAPVIAGFLASVLCSLSILRHQKPPWSHALLSILLGVCSSLVAVFGGEAFSPSRWPARIPEQWDSFVMALAASIPLSIVVAIIVVALFQDRFKKHLTVKERNELRRLRQATYWLRVRWFNLIASSAITACLTTFLVCLNAGPVSSGDTAVSDDYSGALNWNPAPPAASPSKTALAKPLIALSQAAAIFSPFCVLGLFASGGWLAFTLAYWRGYLKVRPRHRRHFPSRHHSLVNVR